MNIRPTRSDDIPAIEAIFDSARRYMRLTGNMEQWNDGYPDGAAVAADMERGVSYVMENSEGRVVATFAFIPGEEPTYRLIAGRWLSDRPYCAIHRIASDGSERGVLSRCVKWGFDRSDSIRIDTHADNRPMRAALAECGFTECGVIHLLNGDERIAFQKDISPL